MKIFEFKFDKNISDWIFAPTKKEAKKFYKNHAGIDNCNDYEIIKIPKNQWDSCYILDPNEMEPDLDDLDYCIDYPNGHNDDDYVNGLKIEMSFSEYAKDNSITDIIATTEF